MALFGPPDPEALKAKGNVKGLIKALSYKKDPDVRLHAARVLEGLGAQAAIPAIARQMEAETDSWRKWHYGKLLRNMGYRPGKGKAAAYFALLGDYEACVASGEDGVFGELVRAFIESDDDWSVYDKLGNAFLSMGEGTILGLTTFTDALYAEYRKYTDTVRSINYSQNSGRQTKAVIERYASKLGAAARILAKFDHPVTLAYCAGFYRRIRTEVYSVPDDYFDDIYDSEKIRTKIVQSLNLFSEALESVLFEVLSDVMLNDEASNVRWNAVLVLEKHQIQAVKNDEKLQGALQHVLAHVPSVVNRSYYSQRIKVFISAQGDDIPSGGG
jgi:hypothetical protein